MDETHHAHPHGYAPHKDQYLTRLKRIEGQVRGIAKMVDENKYCIDILTQVAAVNKALHSVSLGLLEDHLGHCVAEAALQADQTCDQQLIDHKVAEATAAVGRLLR